MLSQTLLSALAIAGAVEAGHRSFEPKLGNVVAVSLGEDPFSITSNSSDDGHHHGRRWVATKGDIWPDKRIPYCFKDTTARSKLYEPIRDAWKKWHAAGLPNNFRMDEVSDSKCRDDRSNVLLVKYNAPRSEGGESKLETTLGKGDDPEMNLTDDVSGGMMDLAANIAHEIGHAWGLDHEHQNPYFWTNLNGYKGKGGTTFGPANWLCENLADYQKTIDKINELIDKMEMGELTIGPHKELICKSRSVASSYGFSAKDWLPLTAADDFTPGTTSTDDADVDWKSIMMYPSQAGGRTEGGNRLQVMRKPNGDAIPMNKVPSARDIRGLIALYGSGDYSEELHNDPNSNKLDLFFEVRNDDVGGCD